MMQPAEPWHGNNSTTCTRALCCRPAWRRFLLQCKMRPVIVVVTDVFTHQSLQMALVEYDDIIE
jgi:hypothetical protein